ncbi:MAG TPA: acyltransferase [Longimicrobium sp.]|nr:acyltransferase [Longimicrobium sp.]
MSQYTIYNRPAEQASGSPAHLASLDGLRFVAAMHIVLFHTMHLAWLRPVTWGSTSTSLFFILSGFVLAYAYTTAEGGLRVPARVFWRRRFARLYPLAVLTQLAVIPFVWHRYPAEERVPRATAALTGVQGWFPRIADSFNSPGWSLSVLAFCYLLFPVLAWALRGWSARRLAWALAATWAASLLPITAALLGGAGEYWRSAVHHHPLSRFPEFVFGVVLARLFVTLPSVQVPRGTVGAVVALLAAALVLLPDAAYPLAHNGLLAPLHGLLIVALAAGGGVLARGLAAPPLRAMGRASFAVFLLHVPVYSWVMIPLAPTLTRMPLPVRIAGYAGYLALAVVAAWAAQRWVADPIAGAIGGRRGAAASKAAAIRPRLAGLTAPSPKDG